MTPLCTPDDVADRLDTTYEGSQLTQVARLCADASGVIRARRPLIDAWLASGVVDRNVVVGVACQLAARLLTSANTGGVGVRAETHPEYSYELTGSAAAGLSLTKAELALLTPATARTRPFSVLPY